MAKKSAAEEVIILTLTVYMSWFNYDNINTCSS